MNKTVKDFVAEALEQVKEIEPARVKERLGEPGLLILDVREPEEFAAGHMPGAINIPRGFLEVRADLEHPKRDARLGDRNQKVICYCAGGVRSAMAAKTLKEMGFENPHSMNGGWTRWTEENLPSESEN